MSEYFYGKKAYFVVDIRQLLTDAKKVYFLTQYQLLAIEKANKLK